MGRICIQAVPSTMTSEQNNFAMRGTLEGHAGWVTSIATTNENPDMILSASRDKTVMVWQLTREDGSYGYPKKALRGHGHFVQDVVISSDGQFALSGSWDGTLRLWDLNTGLTTRRFVGHEKDVLSVAFSADNRQIVSGSRDKTIKLWNTLGECKYTIEAASKHPEGHSEWVSCVSFSPNAAHPLIVSGGWDKLVKVWNLSNCKLRTNLQGHNGYINAVTVSPDGSLCASGGKDGVAMRGTSTRANACTVCHVNRVISSIPFASPPTATGCALLQAWESESGILKAKALLMSSSLSCPQLMPSRRLCQLHACLWLGLQMATHCLLATLIPTFGFGK